MRVILCFGFIKPYKGVIHLIDAAPQLKRHFGDGVRVLVVGDIYGDRAPYFDRVASLAVGDVLQIVDTFVPDETVEDYFVAADLVVLPYVSATQSGIVQIAYNYDTPVVSTRVGGLPEVVLDGVTGYLVPPGDPEALAQAVIRFFQEERAADFAAGVSREKKKYSWDQLVDAVEILARTTPE
jgi:glycosyltransferase involved in cell wall biosynthesis